MAGLELHARYRAGKGGVLVTFADGTTVQLESFAQIRFDRAPRKIEGRLYRVGRRSTSLAYEAPALERAS